MLFLWVKKSELPWNASLRVLKKHGLLIHVKAKPQPAGKRFQRRHVDSMWQGVVYRHKVYLSIGYPSLGGVRVNFSDYNHSNPFSITMRVSVSIVTSHDNKQQSC